MPRHKIKIGGKFTFDKLSKELQGKVIKGVEKNKGLSFKIDGEPVTPELVKKLETKAKELQAMKVVKPKKEKFEKVVTAKIEGEAKIAELDGELELSEIKEETG